MRSRVVALALALTCAGCAGGAQFALQLARGAAYLSDAISVADAGSRVYFSRHPSQVAEPQIAAALKRARESAAVLSGALAQPNQGDPVKARQEAARAYAELAALLVEAGVVAGAAIGGAETSAPLPGALGLPSSSDVAAALQ